jgi:hypothetical protein
MDKWKGRRTASGLPSAEATRRGAKRVIENI